MARRQMTLDKEAALGRYWLSLMGWMFITLGVMGLVLPLVPTDADGGSTESSVTLVLVCVVMLALGCLIVVKTRGRRD